MHMALIDNHLMMYIKAKMVELREERHDPAILEEFNALKVD